MRHCFTPTLIIAAFTLAFTGMQAQARAASGHGPEASADVPLHVNTRATPETTTPRSANAAVTDADVGDADSFGRNMHWLSLTDMTVELNNDCSTTPTGCQVLAVAPAITSFSFNDLGHVTLPAKATSSLLCYWLSPVLNIGYGNPTAAPVVARLNYSPTLTIENPVLATPGLIDPTTGLPFGGKLLTSMTASERFQVPLPAGIHISERTRDSAVCIAGFMSRKTLSETYGLSAAQVTEFFKQPTTVRMNISGSAQYVDFASLYFGLRIIGD